MKQFFGDGEYAFALTFDLAHAFERDNQKSLYATMRAILAGEWRVRDVAEIIRLALIGGGTEDVRAFELVETYVKGRPLAPSTALAQAILEDAFFPDEDPVKAEVDRVFGADDAE